MIDEAPSDYDYQPLLPILVYLHTITHKQRAFTSNTFSGLDIVTTELGAINNLDVQAIQGKIVQCPEVHGLELIRSQIESLCCFIQTINLVLGEIPEFTSDKNTALFAKGLVDDAPRKVVVRDGIVALYDNFFPLGVYPVNTVLNR